jgi:hypothetical protein
VLVTNFTSWADPVRQENPQQTKGPPTSGEYINNFDFVKHILIIFQSILRSSLCGFHQHLWKNPAYAILVFVFQELTWRGRLTVFVLHGSPRYFSLP